MTMDNDGSHQLSVGVVLSMTDGYGPMRGQPAPGWTDLRAVGEIADGVPEIDTVLVGDHLLVRNRPGVVEGDAALGAWDAWTALAALAASTRRVRIAPFVACALFRNPALIAKMADTMDEVSGGRFVLGLGAGYIESEFSAFGFPFDHRASRFEEALQIIVPLLREGRVDFEGTYYQARQCELRPRGPTPGGPPVWIAGDGPRMCELVARYADGYFIYRQRTAEAVAEQYARVDAACRLVRRDPATLQRAAFVSGDTIVPVDGSPPSTPAEDNAARLHALCETVGAGTLILQVWGPTHLERLIPIIEALSRLTRSIAAAPGR
jgi:alkanesulfonate monooxygenase SsuD/methylene tetrahydromethanopterin reductase-like flavin-dependent oxidoreductase (luciferase family)